jgi:phage gpG-like protein
MLPSELLQNILSDIRVEINEGNDKNFTRKAFFTEKWARRKFDDGKGSLMMRTGHLRSSIRMRTTSNGLVVSTNAVYAQIHNEGGEVTVTRKMKRYFWAKYYEASGKVKTLKNGSRSKSKSSTSAQAGAEFYKAMALKKTGTKIKIPQRQFLGWHASLEQNIKSIIEDCVKEYFVLHNVNCQIYKS